MKKTVKIISLILAFIMTAAVFFGCANKPAEVDPTHPPISEPTDAPADPTSTPNPGSKSLGIRPANGSGAAPQGEVEAAYIGASNAFAAALVNAMGENWTGVVSPVSFGMLLEMLANGASDEASVAILHAMLMEMGLEASNENAARLIAALTKPVEASDGGKQPTAPSKFSMNSAILVNSGDSFTESFETAIADHFHASVGNIDFTDSEKALEIINGWVNENTNGLIPQLFDHITPDTTMALINALYFNASWKTPFVTYKNNPDSDDNIGMFQGVNGEQPASMMTASSVYACGEFNGDQVVLIPYADGEYYMAVILPAEGRAANAALANTIDKFDQCVNASAFIAMPAIELTTNFNAMPILDKLGLGGIANGETLFPNIVEGGIIRLTQFVHAAVLKVNEAGTEAGAASGATGTKTAPAPDPQYSIVCNRPYAMAIVHAETGAVLFASVVNEIPAVKTK